MFSSRSPHILYAMNFEAVIRTPTAWISVFSRFTVHLFEGHVTLADMDRMQAVGERWKVQHPEKRVEIGVIFPSDARMTHEERTRMARLIKLGEAQRAASATVILAQGLMASMQRSMLTGMLMIAPPPHPQKVFGSIPDALAWLGPHVEAVCGGALNLDELSNALTAHIAQFRARNAERSAAADPPRT
jgi:hypothetical protein